MRVLHCCLAAFYNEGYGYQENILPRMHKKQGHEVKIVASTEKFVDKMNLGYVEACTFVNEDGIEVIRLPYSSCLSLKIAAKLRLYKGLERVLAEFAPDVIFMHDAQFLSILVVVDYLKQHPEVRLFVDGHTDFGNSARTFVSKYILHGIIYRWCVKKIEPYVEKFYGTLPSRVDFFVDFYKTPKSKTELLVMGADDDCIAAVKKANMREQIRAEYKIGDKTLLLVTGGKFDERKTSVLNLMTAVKRASEKYDVKLLIFGSVMEGDFKRHFEELCDGETVIYVGWVNSAETYAYFEAGDLVVFTGSHSVLWEQAVGQGKPCIFSRYMGLTHIDVGGNCLFLNDTTEQEIYRVISEAVGNYDQLKESAETNGVEHFSYDRIAARAIE